MSEGGIMTKWGLRQQIGFVHTDHMRLVWYFVKGRLAVSLTSLQDWLLIFTSWQWALLV